MKFDVNKFESPDDIPLIHFYLDTLCNDSSSDTDLEVSRDVYKTSLTDCKLKVSKKNLRRKVSSSNSNDDDCETTAGESLEVSEEDDSDEDYNPNIEATFKSKFVFKRNKGGHKYMKKQERNIQPQQAQSDQQEIVTLVRIVQPGENIEDLDYHFDSNFKSSSKDGDEAGAQDKDLVQLAFEKACDADIAEGNTNETDEQKESDKTLHIFGKSFTLDLKCEECNETFDDCFKLKRHMIIHKLKADEVSVKKTDFTCYICTRKFNARNLLWAHMRVHSRSVPYKCKGCSFTTMNSIGLYRHKQICDSRIENDESKKSDKPERSLIKKYYKCYYCNERFSDTHQLQVHQKLHLPKGLSSKRKISPTTENNGNIPSHCNVSSNDKTKSIESENCTNKDQASITLDNLRIIEMKPKFKCCGTIFSERFLLFSHMQEQETTSNGIAKCNPEYVCNVCSDSFSERLDWYLHSKIRHKYLYEQRNSKSSIIMRKPKYACGDCYKKFDTIGKLEEHKVTCQKDSERKKVVHNDILDLKMEFKKSRTGTNSGKNQNYDQISDDSCIIVNSDADIQSIKEIEQNESTTDIQMDVTLTKLSKDIKDTPITSTDVPYRCDICYDEFTDHAGFLEHEAFHRELETPKESTSQKTQDVSQIPIAPILKSALTSQPVLISLQNTQPDNQSLKFGRSKMLVRKIKQSLIPPNLDEKIRKNYSLLLSQPITITTKAASTVTTAAPKILTPTTFTTIGTIMVPKIVTPTTSATFVTTPVPKIITPTTSATIGTTMIPKIITPATSATFVTTPVPKIITPTTSATIGTTMIPKIITPATSATFVTTSVPKIITPKTSGIFVTTPVPKILTPSSSSIVKPNIFTPTTSAAILNSMVPKILTPSTSTTRVITTAPKVINPKGSPKFKVYNRRLTTTTGASLNLISKTFTTSITTPTQTAKNVYILNSSLMTNTSLAELLTSGTKPTTTAARISETAAITIEKSTETLCSACSCNNTSDTNFCECKLKVNIINKKTSDNVIVLSDDSDEEATKKANKDIVDLTDDNDVTTSKNKVQSATIEDEGLNCLKCLRHFKSKKMLDNHVRSTLFLHRCSFCKFDTCGIRDLKQHYQTEHGGNYMCRFCFRLFLSSDILVDHLERHKCKGCKAYYSNLETHINHCNMIVLKKISESNIQNNKISRTYSRKKSVENTPKEKIVSVERNLHHAEVSGRNVKQVPALVFIESRDVQETKLPALVALQSLKDPKL